ncbi:aminoglycoside phosphotransferase family protein [Rhizobium sp. RU36D]|uniref:aminoglycoside phosphotransferase family protein n=1 Tax=Rhizobium sp. RU36D TaxID=1907415 RepID=UPI0009D7A33A|nr:aminoglycoside phosphotransferase family protein [Rhizobium sp. RU36D]SMC91735.1 Predicted kinase, aminoglycoside phosphotransferase (APT) family [Rhizobium sp. RU36D]
MADDRLDISTPLVRALIADQFPQWVDLHIAPLVPGGWNNRSFRLGEAMSVRMPSAERYAAQVEKEQTTLPKLAPHLPLPITKAIAMGKPGRGYPFPFGIYGWIEGETAKRDRIHDMGRFALDLAQFLNALRAINASDGIPAGAHNFFRGGDLAVYEAEARAALALLGEHLDQNLLTEILDLALSSRWQHPPVWVHGDIAWGNLLVRDGQLAAVIDFGSCGTGDPACDLAIAWTLFDGESRAVFRKALGLEADVWQRARGWTLWKALIVLAQEQDKTSAVAAEQREVIQALAEDHVQERDGAQGRY